MKSKPDIAVPKWMFYSLFLAGIYNLLWGTWVVLCPNALLRWAGLGSISYPQLWQSVGMIVGVYGIGYLIAAYDPLRHWPIVLVGLLGKVLGPIGFVVAAHQGELPWRFGCVNVTNDLIWWIPFTLILLQARQQANRKQE